MNTKFVGRLGLSDEEENARWPACSCGANCKIADDNSRDYKKKIGTDGKVTWVVDRAHIARCRLRINTRKRILAWMAPRKYGNG
jgi:hypothetical protein